MKKAKAFLNIFAVALMVATFMVPAIVFGQTTAYNTGSLGSIGDGVNSSGVIADLVGPLEDPNDVSVGYPNTNPGGWGPYNTQVPYLSELNAPGAFTIEFWVQPEFEPTGAGPSPVFNRTTTSPRSGWVFYQRPAGVGWNFRMYNGVGTNMAIDLTGGTSAAYSWSHIVAVWDGMMATLYHNGSPVASGFAEGTYVPNVSGLLSIGTHDDGEGAYLGLVDEFALYDIALSAGQVQAHFDAASSTEPGAYSALVLLDGALEYLQQQSGAVSVEEVSWSKVKSLYR